MSKITIATCPLCQGEGELRGRVAIRNRRSAICPLCRGSGAMPWLNTEFERKRAELKRREKRS